MAAEFIGSTVVVTLRIGNTQVQGTVANIVGQQLTLHKGDNLDPILTICNLANKLP